MALPSHLFASDCDGALYDTRRPDWSRNPPLRPLWSRHCGTDAFADPARRSHAFKAALRAGMHAWPGGYPLAFTMRDGGMVCYSCARAEARAILAECRYARHHGGAGSDPGLLPGWVEIQWESYGETCDMCGAEIESAYGDPDTDD
jgi:hypothetical protein